MIVCRPTRSRVEPVYTRNPVIADPAPSDEGDASLVRRCSMWLAVQQQSTETVQIQLHRETH